MPKIVTFILCKNLIEQSGPLMGMVKTFCMSLMTSMFYRRKVYNYANINDAEYHTSGILVNIKEELSQWILPIYVNKIESVVTVDYIPIIHSVATHEENGEELLVKYKKSKSDGLTSSYKLTGGVLPKYLRSTVSDLYPSENYKRLSKIISTHFRVSLRTRTFSVVGILLDGVPGLGKTKFSDFATSQKLAKEVYKVDMTSFLQLPFDKVMEVSYYNINSLAGPLIFVIDELDKYIDYRIVAEQRERADKQNEKKLDYVPESLPHMKSKYLYDMLRVLERDDFTQPVIVLFCSNNFQTIFKDVDVTHHRSLWSRFMKVKFNKCDRSEIASYIDFYNQKLQGTEDHCDVSLGKLKETLNADVMITHRELHYVAIEANYNAVRMVKLINDNREEVNLEHDSMESVSWRDVPIININKNTSDKSTESLSELDETSDECSEGEVNDRKFEQMRSHNLHDYNNKPLTSDIMTKLSEYINKINDNKSPSEQIATVNELYKYVSNSEDVIECVELNLKEMMAIKTNYFIDHKCNVFYNTDYKTKRYIYSITGREIEGYHHMDDVDNIDDCNETK